jgi:hypothetical protein
MARRDGRPATNRDAKDTRCISLTNRDVTDREKSSLLTAPQKRIGVVGCLKSFGGVELGVELEVSMRSLASLDPLNKQGSPQISNSLTPNQDPCPPTSDCDQLTGCSTPVTA